MALEIRQTTIVLSAGGGGHYDVTPKDTATFDIGDRFNAEPTWCCVAAWWHASDLEHLSAFYAIEVRPYGDGSDVQLRVRNKKRGQIVIVVSAAYEHA
jgi:hypothetical protein